MPKMSLTRAACLALCFALLFLALPVTATAAVAPAGQVSLKAGDVLRGSFVQVTEMKGVDAPMQSSGRFVVAPGHGLIWQIEKPLATATIITPQGSVQDFGGIAVKLPIRNLSHLYATIGGALMGNWRGLEKDFVITRSEKGGRWQMLLTPRHKGRAALPYRSIAVSGARFIESIAMVGNDGGSDTLSFADEVLGHTPLSANEKLAFNEVHP
ncbi:MAG TPA: outer membrane lipoprotein carrier protein LolA [Alphaproteobacteria bacterium]|nr:outer membrane lipoprotein carrier protein LolA [Alphaproteobacteria bacterium]